MAWLWVILGVAVLAAVLFDILLTCLDYDASGFLVIPLCALMWRTLRFFTRRLGRRWRPVVLRQITGLQMGLCLATWLAVVVVGYALIYYGAMWGRNGTSQIAAETDVLRAVTVVETLSGLVLITLSLTFLLGIYQVVRSLSALCAQLFNVATEPGNAVASLSPYFPQGQATDLNAYLQSLHDALSAYIDGVRLHRLAYFFQSGRDHFSLPYATQSLAELIAALRWGLPSENRASQEPALAALSLRFKQLADYLHAQLRRTDTDVPEPASFDTFVRAYYEPLAPAEAWLDRFRQLNETMGRLVQLDPLEDPRRAYKRYRQWLPFTVRAQALSAAVCRDLDYRPDVGQPTGKLAGEEA